MNEPAHYLEKTRCFGPDKRLIGTVTTPRLPPMRALPGLILLNAGVVPRIGPHRLNVELARNAAKLGICAIRFDFPGLGDSGFTSSRLAHDEQALESIGHAMDELRATPSAPKYFVIAGLCSGADVGLQMALRDPHISGLFMIEPYYYPNALSGLLRTSRRLWEYGLFRALRRVSAMAGQALSRRPAAPGEMPMDPEEDARPTPEREQFTQQLNELLQRGTQLQLIYANSLMGRYDLWHHKRHIFRKLHPNKHFSLTLAPGTDHSFTRIESREQLVKRMHDWLQQQGHRLGDPSARPRTHRAQHGKSSSPH